MEIKIYDNKKMASEAAANMSAKIIRNIIFQKGEATIVVATGASQFDFIDFLTRDTSIDWNKVEMFHLDEYVGLSKEHPASFRNYLQRRLISKVKPGKVNLIEADSEDLQGEICRLNSLLRDKKIDISFVGIGENGHLAFNDPPADFEVKDPYIIVELDKRCRKQQVNEGWFESIEEVPEQAVSMSINEIMRSKNIICTVPGKRKARAVKDCFYDDTVSTEYPASILKKHDKTYVILDKDSASLIKGKIV